MSPVKAGKMGGLSTAKIRLQNGANQIRFTGDTRYVELDFFDIRPVK